MRVLWPLCLVAAAGVALSSACAMLPGGGGSSAASQSASVPVLRETFSVSVKARGELEADQASPIAVPKVPTGALKVKELAPEGSMVAEGDIIVVFDDSVDLAQQARFAMEFCAVESCGKCTPCRIGSVRGVEVIDRVIANEERAFNLQVLDDLCDTMVEGSLCAMGGLTPYPVRSAIKYFPEDFNR